VGNAICSIPAALAAGVVGVVTATALTGAVASIYFVVLCRREEGLPLLAPGRRWWDLAFAAVGVTVAGELVILQTSLHGFLALALSGIPALIAWAIFAAGLRKAPTAQVAARP
jgi:hypothetical protein